MEHVPNSDQWLEHVCRWWGCSPPPLAQRPNVCEMFCLAHRQGGPDRPFKRERYMGGGVQPPWVGKGRGYLPPPPPGKLAVVKRAYFPRRQLGEHRGQYPGRAKRR